MRIIAVEHPVTVPVTNRRGEVLEKPLVAVFDLVTREEGEAMIHDFKTSRSAYSELDADTSLQATCYITAGREVFGGVRFRYTVLVKTTVPKVQRRPVERHVREIGRLGDLIENVERAVKAKAFFPIESPQNCSTCPYRKPCREWGTGERNHRDRTPVETSETSKC